MDLRIRSRAGDEITQSLVLPVGYQHLQLAGSQPMSTTSPFGNMLFQHFAGTGFDIWFSTYDITEPVSFLAREDMSILELHIATHNTLSGRWDGIAHEHMAEKQFDLSFTPYVDNEMFFDHPGLYQTFDIHYHKATLQQFSAHFPLLDVFLHKVESGHPASLFGSTRFLNPAMERIIHDMRHCSYVSALASVYYECKAIELLIEILHSLSGAVEPTEKVSLTTAQYAEAAHILILADLAHIYSTDELARKVGTNAYTLLYAFKRLFGTTPFKFGERLRMELARKLLLETTDPIAHVGWKVGYTEVQNFYIAFKRHFRVPPDHCVHGDNFSFLIKNIQLLIKMS